MRSILRQLDEVAGVKGSLVITPDGMVVASHLAPGLAEDLVAAMASAALHGMRRTLSPHALQDFRRLTLVASHGKLVIAAAGPAYLVVVMDRNADVGPVRIEIESTAMRIRQRGEIRV